MSLPVSTTRYMLLGGVPTEMRTKYSPLPKLKPETIGPWKSWAGMIFCCWLGLVVFVGTPFSIRLIWPWMEATRIWSLKIVSCIICIRVALSGRNGEEREYLHSQTRQSIFVSTSLLDVDQLCRHKVNKVLRIEHVGIVHSFFSITVSTLLLMRLGR